MKLGFVSAILHDQSLAQVLAFAAEQDFGCVELMCWPVGKAERKFAGVTHMDVNNLTEERVDEVYGLATHQGIEISGLGYYPNPLDPDPKVSERAVEHLKKVILGAEKFGLWQVNTFVGRDWTKSIDDNWPRFLKIWKPLIRFAEDHDVRIGIENCPMYFTADEWPGGKNLAISPAIWERMFSDISSPHFGLNYDPSHLVWQGMDWLQPLRDFREKLFHIHAKDVRVLREKLNQVGIFAHPKEFHQPRIPGFGEIDWAEFMGVLFEVNYDGPVCIEVEDDTFGKTLEGRQRALKVSRNVLQPYIV
ncbi:MAG: sugar phosphate isomerase/epimerase family protein [Limisphaerales bacterium]